MHKNEAMSWRIPLQRSLTGLCKNSKFITIVAFLHVKKLPASMLPYFIVCITAKIKNKICKPADVAGERK